MAPKTGGPRSGILSVNRQLRKLGHQVEVATVDHPDIVLNAPEAEVWHCFGPAAGYGNSPELSGWLDLHISVFDAVILHGHWQYPAWAASKAACKHEIPYVIYSHGMLDRWFNRTYPLKYLKKQIYWWAREYFVVSRANAVLHTSRQESERSAGAFWPCPKTFEVVPYGIEAVAEVSEEKAGCGAGSYMLFLGRIAEKKGIDLLIQSFIQEVPAGNALKLIIAGPCANSSYLEFLKRLAGSDERVRFMNAVDGHVKDQLIRGADVFCLPSHQENFGIAVAEALSAGVPVLITREVGIWREVVDAGAGHAEVDDLDGVVRLIHSWLRMGNKERAEMRIRARECFEKHFNSMNAASALLTILNRNISRNPY